MPKGGIDFGRGQRPVGIKIISVLEVAAAAYLILGILAFGIVRLFGIGSLLSFVTGLGQPMLIIFSVVLLASAYGMWEGKRWGYWLGLVIGAFMTITIVLLDLLGFVFGIILIWYLTRKRTHKWFRLN